MAKQTLLEAMENVGMTDGFIHVPVMHREVLNFLNVQPGYCVVDATLGTGGHALTIAEGVGAGGRLIGIDRDSDSLNVARERLKNYSGRCQFVHSDFRNIDTALKDLGIQKVDGILFDLGISSFQLENAVRGFSLKLDGPLDMRMDKNSYISAHDLINSLSEREISAILKNFGEERWHNRIARHLIEERKKNAFATTKELREVVLKAIPRKFQNQKIHPATRTFQAFRIAVNRELEALDLTLDKCVYFLRKGARLCVISFHSLEDRIVKEKFRRFAKEGTLQLLTKKPLYPSDEEINNNPRSRSARLRAAERI